MKCFEKALLFLGLAFGLALGFTEKGSVGCDGLFLLHLSDKHLAFTHCGAHDTVGVSHTVVYGGYDRFSLKGRYSDDWKILGESSPRFGSAGVQGRFKYITLGAEFYGLPWTNAFMTVNGPDSLFYGGTSMGFGHIDLGTISWIPETETDLLREIPVNWESELLHKGISLGSKWGSHRLEIQGHYVESHPQNPEEEYYIRDSIEVWGLLATYERFFDQGGRRLRIDYGFVDASAYLFGIMEREGSRKRFMYLPLELRLHLAEVSYDDRQINLHGVFAYFSAQLKSDSRRFYETFAANRVLPSSIMQTLSFSFLQKTFRIDADIDGFGALAGGKYHRDYGKNFVVAPYGELDGYFVTGTASVDRESETRSLLSSKSRTESFDRELTSFGTLLTLGVKLAKTRGGQISLDWSASQIIPFYMNYQEIKPESSSKNSSSGSSGSGSSKGGSGSSSTEETTEESEDSGSKNTGDIPNKLSGIFRNGFGTSLTLNFRF